MYGLGNKINEKNTINGKIIPNTNISVYSMSIKYCIIPIIIKFGINLENYNLKKHVY